LRLFRGSLTVFITSAIAIIPLAVWLSTATEEVAVVTGPSIGALLNAVFNATELIIALVALKAGLVDIVKASITGTIISNLLLMGLSMLLGGLQRTGDCGAGGSSMIDCNCFHAGDLLNEQAAISNLNYSSSGANRSLWSNTAIFIENP